VLLLLLRSAGVALSGQVAPHAAAAATSLSMNVALVGSVAPQAIATTPLTRTNALVGSAAPQASSLVVVPRLSFGSCVVAAGGGAGASLSVATATTFSGTVQAQASAGPSGLGAQGGSFDTGNFGDGYFNGLGETPTTPLPTISINAPALAQAIGSQAFQASLAGSVSAGASAPATPSVRLVGSSGGTAAFSATYLSGGLLNLPPVTVRAQAQAGNGVAFNTGLFNEGIFDDPVSTALPTVLLPGASGGQATFVPAPRWALAGLAQAGGSASAGLTVSTRVVTIAQAGASTAAALRIVQFIEGAAGGQVIVEGAFIASGLQSATAGSQALVAALLTVTPSPPVPDVYVTPRMETGHAYARGPGVAPGRAYYTDIPISVGRATHIPEA
jgi:hypothetical protein